ncbi:MAG: SpoIIE family protein phosphatase [Treponema sp.]|nr:SpoIIE family protein phosphatase [Treponema sp.]
MTSIDSFIGFPLLVIAILGAILILFLAIIKIRKTANVSFVTFISTALIAIGALLSNALGYYMYFVISAIVAMVVLTPYLIIKIFDTPERKKAAEQKKAEAAALAARSQDSVSKAELNALETKYQRLIDVNKELISKLSSFFSNDNSMENYLEYCNGLLTEKVSADGCVILIADEYDNTLAVKSFKGSFPPPYKLPEDLPHKPIRVETNLRFAQFQLKDNIFGDIFSSGEPVLIEDSVKDPRVFQNGPEDFLRCGSYIFVPIKQQEGVIGLVALARKPENSAFTRQEFEDVTILTDAISTTMKPLYSFLAYAEHTELNKDGSIASKYQKTMMPAKLPVIPGLSIGCFTNPMESVCGDYYDVIASRKDRISFIMTDVAGKGMNSLIVMIMIRAILRLAVNTNQDSSTILSWTNRGICSESSKIDHFASVALITYDSTSKEAEVATCGNNPVFLYSSMDKSLKQISDPSEPLGVSKDAIYKNIKLNLQKGDIIVTCTDGVIEALNENGVQYSTESLKKVIIKNSNASAKEISNKIKDDLKKYCGITQQYDDQSLLAIKID